MTDDLTPDSGTPDPATRPDVARAARSATGRARRIGGRPVAPAAPPRTVAAAADAPADAAPADTAPAAGPPTSSTVRMEKTRTAPAEPIAEPVAHDNGPGAPRPTAERGSPWAWAPAAVLGVAALVFAVLIAVFAARDDKPKPTASTRLPAADTAIRQQVLAAAKACVVRVNSYDYRTFAQDEQAALQCTTGQYSKDFKKTFEGVIMKYGPKLHATQTAQIDTAGIEQVSPDGQQWTLLLFGQLTATNNSSAQSGRVDPLAIKVVMQRVKGQWLIEQLSGA